jgi:hypothetical protein
MKIKVPGPVAKFVTTIQIWQFIISVAILAHLGWLVYGQKVYQWDWHFQFTIFN